MKLVIDPGHGGRATGVVYNRDDGSILVEKEANLATALTLKHVLIHEFGAAFDIELTRTTDEDTPFHARTKRPADLLVSIHYDAPWGRRVIYHQQYRCPSCYVAQRLNVVTGDEYAIWSTTEAAHTGGRLYIDDAKHLAVLVEVDRISDYRDSREYRLARTRPLAKAIMEVMSDIPLLG